MELDVKTLLWLNVVVALVISAVTYSFWSNHQTIRGLRGWSIGLFLIGLGGLTLLLRETPPWAVTTILPSALIVSGFSVVWLSIRRFNDTRFDLRRVALSVLFFAGVFTVAWLSGAQMRDRVVMVSTLVGVLALLAGWELVKGNRVEPLRGRLPTALAFTLLGSTMLARAGLILSSASATSPVLEDQARSVTLFISTICFVGVTLGLLMMSNERLRGRYARLALTDELTELPNRRFFLEQGERLCKRAHRDAASACLLIMDLDHFSSVNEKFGHAGGDQALVAFSDLLRRTMRPNDLICRYGGEEFAALLIGAGLPEAATVAERVRVALTGHAIEIHGRMLDITVSIGVAAMKDGDLRATIRMADEALYRAKAGGRNQIAIATPNSTNLPLTDVAPPGMAT